MPIRYYEGVEGSGKTCMMSRDLLFHYASGGRVLAFPGYELYGNTKKEVLSETLLPEQWVTLPDELKRQKIAIAIDEVNSFFNHHNWYNKICDMMYSLLAQRRKFEIAVLMTGPIFYNLPPDIRSMIHEVVHCADNHQLNHAIHRGEKCIYTKEDLRGLLSRPTQRFSRKKVFMMRSFWHHYDSWAAVDAINQFITVKFKKREIIIGADGKVITAGYDSFNSKVADTLIQKKPEDNFREEVRKALQYLKERDVDYIEPQTMGKLFPNTKLKGVNSLGTILKEFGVRHIAYKRQYDLTNVEV